MANQSNSPRVLNRAGARELSAEETEKVSGACTFRTTFIRGAAVDTLVDDCFA